VGWEGGLWEEAGEGGEMTQTLYTYMNKIKKKNDHVIEAQGATRECEYTAQHNQKPNMIKIKVSRNHKNAQEFCN
jgi:hypothetical protein